MADADALVVRRAGEQQRRDELAGGGGVDHHRPTADPAAALDRERQRAATVVVDRGTESAQGVEDTRHRSGAGVRVTVEGDRPGGERRHRGHEPHHRAGQPAVDDTAVQRPRRHRPVRAVGVDPVTRAQVRAVAISSVSRERRARRTTEGPSANAASTSARLVSDFEPGSSTRASTGPRAVGAGHRSSDCRLGASPRPRGYWPSDFAASRASSLASLAR